MTGPNLAAVWKLSSSLKRAQLQHIATSIGAPLSGTKTQLLDGIHDLLAVTEGQTKSARTKTKVKQRDGGPQDLRVLSIDMGIRNLAFAFLTCRANDQGTTSKDKKTPLTKAMFTKPELRQWRRIELFNFDRPSSPDPKPTPKTTTRTTTKTKTKTIKTKPSQTPNLDPDIELATSPSHAPPAESFEPPTLATHAYSFAKYCASLQPTHILIERQRFRSGGHAAVQEWSLRVGMLEAMLHAMFLTFRREGVFPEGKVHVEPILPMRVNKYWFGEREDLIIGEGAERESTSGKQSKLAKIAIVHDLLNGVGGGKADAAFSVHDEVRPMVDAFTAKVNKRAGSRREVKGRSGLELEKLDDVADSLLQGLAWLKWQENRRRLLHDPTALDVD